MHPRCEPCSARHSPRTVVDCRTTRQRQSDTRDSPVLPVDFLSPGQVSTDAMARRLQDVWNPEPRKVARSSCCVNAIVGGLSGISALSESKGKTETQKSTMLHLVAGPFTPILKPAIPSSYYFTARYPSSPPSREIYILTSALLI